MAEGWDSVVAEIEASKAKLAALGEDVSGQGYEACIHEGAFPEWSADQWRNMYIFSRGNALRMLLENRLEIIDLKSKLANHA